MKKEDFENLVDIIRQAGKIRRGQAVPSRVMKFHAVNVKKREASASSRRRNPLAMKKLPGAQSTQVFQFENLYSQRLT